MKVQRERERRVDVLELLHANLLLRKLRLANPMPLQSVTLFTSMISKIRLRHPPMRPSSVLENQVAESPSSLPFPSTLVDMLTIALGSSDSFLRSSSLY